MQNGINQDSIQRLNRVLIVKILQSRGSYTRADLARISNLRPATISNIINELMTARIVKEVKTVNVGRGRSGIAISLDASYYRVIGVRLSRKYFKIGTYDLAGNEQSASSFDFVEDEPPEKALERVCKQIEEYIGSCQDAKIIAIGCAVPGPFLRENGQTALGSEFPDWANIEIKKRLEKQFGINVFLEHDANAGALAYHWKLSLDSERMLIYFSAGQGIGAGIVNKGKLVLGAIGAAGEVGHMTIEKNGLLCKCGNSGCLEKYCSSIALTDRINNRILLGDYSNLSPKSSFPEIAKAIKAGDKLALMEYENVCDYLGIGVINIVNILNPDTVVIGDELAGVLPEVMQNRIESALMSKLNPVIWQHMEIYVESEACDMVLKGSAIVAIEGLLNNPISFNWVD